MSAAYVMGHIPYDKNNLATYIEDFGRGIEEAEKYIIKAIEEERKK